MHGSDAESTACLRQYTGLPFRETEIVQHFVKDYLARGTLSKNLLQATKIDKEIHSDIVDKSGCKLGGGPSKSGGILVIVTNGIEVQQTDTWRCSCLRM
jgi:hypothetical protein